MPIPRIITPMITPFKEDGGLNLDVACELAVWLVEQGNEALAIAGTTGEAPVLSHDEQIDLIGAVAAAVDVPVMAGAGSNSTATAVELTERSAKAGAASILSVTPYYNRPSQEGLMGHFKAVANSVDLPIYLYDIPFRTGRKIETQTILELAHSVPNISGLKDAAGDPEETGRLIAEAPEDFIVYSGDDALTLELLTKGAVGGIGVSMHWTAPEHRILFDAFEAGDMDKAAEVNKELEPSFEFTSLPDAPNPIPTKVLMNELGFKVGRGRPPMDTVPPQLAEQARQVIATAASRDLI